MDLFLTFGFNGLRSSFLMACETEQLKSKRSLRDEMIDIARPGLKRTKIRKEREMM